MSVANNIKSLRKEFGITQCELAASAGVTQNAVYKWESGYSKPRMSTVRKIAEHYDVPRSRIIEEGGDCYDSSFICAGKYVSCAQAVPSNDGGDTYEVSPRIRKAHPRGFFLKITDEAMQRVYPKDCLVLVDPDIQPETGSIVAVRIDGGRLLTRRMYRGASALVFSPDTAEKGFHDIIIESGENHYADVRGTVVWFQACTELA